MNDAAGGVAGPDAMDGGVTCSLNFSIHMTGAEKRSNRERVPLLRGCVWSSNSWFDHHVKPIRECRANKILAYLRTRIVLVGWASVFVYIVCGNKLES